MGLWRALTRVGYACCALGAATLPFYLGYQALAGVGVLGAQQTPIAHHRVAAPERASSQALQLQSVDLHPVVFQSEPAASSCPTLEEAYASIAVATQGADIATIAVALAELQRDPAGLDTQEPSPLANQLRRELGLYANENACASVLTALREANQLAEIASIAEEAGPTTAAVGAPSALSPSFRTVLPGAAAGARGHGYCPHLSSGCVG